MTKKQGGMLIAAPERWDEACFAIPAVRAIVASGVGVGVMCLDSQRSFWRSVEGVEIVEYSVGVKAKIMASEITGKWQASVAWEMGIAAETFKLAGIAKRLGPEGDRKLGKLITHPLTLAPGPLEHRVQYYLSAVEALGIPTGRAEFFAAAQLGIKPSPAKVMICPGSDFGANHEWPEERWQEIATSVLQEGKRLTICSGECGHEKAKSLAARLGSEVELISLSPLGESLPVLASHSLVIAADGYLPHLAAYAGATCVTLFGPNDVTWKRPMGRRHAVVKRHAECAPCLSPKCAMDMRCQNELETGRVWRAVKEKLLV